MQVGNIIFKIKHTLTLGFLKRRKLESDELQMRGFFEDGDLLVAEEQAFFSDGIVKLFVNKTRRNHHASSGMDNKMWSHQSWFAASGHIS